MTLNLLTGMMEPYVMMDKRSVEDGVGSFNLVWVEGAAFQAFVKKDDPKDVVIAEKQEVREILVVIVFRNTPLEYHDVFKRVSDGAVFRVTSRTLDDAAPDAASTRIAKANCERWELT